MTTSFDHQILDPGQARLRMRSNLVVTPHENATFVLEDPLTSKYFLIGAAEWSFITQLTGAATIAEAVGTAATSAPKGTALTEREGISVARWLIDQGLAHPVETILGGRDEHPAAPPTPFNPLMIRVVAVNPDKLLVTLDRRLGLLWSKGSLAVWAVVGLAALVKLGWNWTAWKALPTQILDRDNWLRLGMVWAALKILHEFGHGLACRHFGIPVRRAGLLLMFFAPVPYVDVSGSWRIGSRAQRLTISAAGMYLELWIAFAAMLLWTPNSLELFDRLCVDLVLLAGLNTVAFNANPLMRFDGYYILADLVGIPNLSGESRRYLSNALRFWFCGLDVSGVGGSGFNRGMIKTYAFASSAWRVLTFLGIAVSLIAQWSWWGAAVSFIVAWFWFGWRLPKSGRSQKAPARSLPGRRRMKSAYAAAAVLAITVSLRLVAPAPVSAPAVVEYSPLTTVRASAAGFVTQVHVEDGCEVEAGELLLELTNDDLATNVRRLEIELRQARLRSRAYLTANDLAEHQKEATEAASLEAQLNEYQSQLDGLKVRAPCRARIVSNDVARLAGRYVEQGEVLLILGSEERKELLLSASSADEDRFVAHTGEIVDIRRPFSSSRTSGVLTGVEPRVQEELPHAALGAETGGDIAVHLQHKGDATEEDLPNSLMPRIRATVRLDEEAARQLRSGQRVIVTLAGRSDTWGGRVLQRWNDYLTELAARHDALSRATETN